LFLGSKSLLADTPTNVTLPELLDLLSLGEDLIIEEGPCPEIISEECPTPSCTAGEIADQMASLAALKGVMLDKYHSILELPCTASDETKTIYRPDPSLLTFPLYLVRIRLCNRTETYVFEGDLPMISGNYEILQVIEIENSNQRFTLNNSCRGDREVCMKELIERRLPIYKQRW